MVWQQFVSVRVICVDPQADTVYPAVSKRCACGLPSRASRGLMYPIKWHNGSKFAEFNDTVLAPTVVYFSAVVSTVSYRTRFTVICGMMHADDWKTGDFDVATISERFYRLRRLGEYISRKGALVIDAQLNLGISRASDSCLHITLWVQMLTLRFRFLTLNFSILTALSVNSLALTVCAEL
jgi:hypothetical protein